MTAYIPMSERSIWADVQPIPQIDGPNPLVPILYAEDYRDAMDFFRAISASGERSERVLELTETIIRKNPAHYTVWGYRFQTLLELNKDLEEELELMNEFARVNLKTYQVWHHRLLLISKLSPSNLQKEIDYIHNALLPDPKNYHTWAYLHWLFSHFHERVTNSQWSEELAWCSELLRVDGRNNSAWGWRWYLQVARASEESDEAYWDAEIKYVVDAIGKIPHNVSAWNYLRGLLDHLKRPKKDSLASLRKFTEGNEPVKYALEFKAESLAESGDQKGSVGLFEELSHSLKMRKCFRPSLSYVSVVVDNSFDHPWITQSRGPKGRKTLTMLEYIFFYGWKVTKDYPISRACFSQWYDAPFNDPKRPGIVFKTAEHWMMASKAWLFDPELADKIIAAPTPNEAKKLGRQVKNFDREIWNEHADDVVQKGNELKFGQHEDLRRYLFGTGKRTLVEASPTDRIWGIGYSAENAMDHIDDWGTNR